MKRRINVASILFAAALASCGGKQAEPEAGPAPQGNDAAVTETGQETGDGARDVAAEPAPAQADAGAADNTEADASTSTATERDPRDVALDFLTNLGHILERNSEDCGAVQRLAIAYAEEHVGELKAAREEIAAHLQTLSAEEKAAYEAGFRNSLRLVAERFKSLGDAYKERCPAEDKALSKHFRDNRLM